MPQGATTTARLAVGQRAPDFALKTHLVDEVRLDQFTGKKHVFIAFYPLAWTPV